MDHHALMSKMGPTILQEIVSIAAEKLGALLAKLPLQRRWEADNYTNIPVQGKVLLQALVESDKSPLIFSQETIAEIFLQVMTSQVTFKLKYGFMIFYEITNRCNCMQSILFHC